MAPLFAIIPEILTTIGTVGGEALGAIGSGVGSLASGIGSIAGGIGSEVGSLAGGALSGVNGVLGSAASGLGLGNGFLGSVLSSPLVEQLGVGLGVQEIGKAVSGSPSAPPAGNNIVPSTPSTGSGRVSGGGATSGISLAGGSNPEVGPWASKVSGNATNVNDPRSFWSTGALGNG